mgnify:CR=1 FL=1
MLVDEKDYGDEFLYKIQQEKMKEIWDNEEDEFWGVFGYKRKKRVDKK